ncbi:hypothetical protein ACFXG6_25200 [Streptomyces roseus]|uniref:hypothetical protein n=1 Tax=Streptomyces roseus TaxID=66430 RepID=UPI0036C36FDF
MVVREFFDPVRGRVECPAAPVVAAGLESAGVGVVTSGRAVPGDDAGVMFTGSFVDRAGRVVGLGVAASGAEVAGMEAARAAVERWVSRLRSRRVLVADTGVCAGTVRAERLSRQRLGASGLGASGRAQAEAGTPDAEGGTSWVVFPAHGVSSSERAVVVGRGLPLVDGTCPLVAAAQADAVAYAARGDVVVVVGRAEHAVTAVLAADAGDSAVRVGSVADVEGVLGLLKGAVQSGRGVSFVVDPALPVPEVLRIAAAVQSRFPALSGHHFDVLCEHASDQAQARAVVVAEADLTLLLGQESLPAGEAMSPFPAAGPGGPVVRVAEIADLATSGWAEATTVGIITGPSVSAGLLESVREAIAGHGPVTVRHKSVGTTAAPAELVARWSGPGEEVGRVPGPARVDGGGLVAGGGGAVTAP